MCPLGLLVGRGVVGGCLLGESCVGGGVDGFEGGGAFVGDCFDESFLVEFFEVLLGLFVE